MKITKSRKAVILILAVVLVLTLAIPSMAGEPDSSGFSPCNAVKVKSSAKSSYYDGIYGKGEQYQKRLNPEAALNAPDATQNGHDHLFVGLRGFSEVTYEFGQDVNRTYRIYNNTDAGKYDLGLTEVTWGTSWHIEAVDVILLDVEKTNGDIVPSLNIGRAFNKMGANNKTLEGFTEGFQVNIDNNFATSGIFFPDDVKSAGAVKLVDQTSVYNKVDKGEFKVASDDGYDLDAMTAYYVKEVGVKLEADKTVKGDADFTTTTFAFEIKSADETVAYGKADVSAKNEVKKIEFTDTDGNPITDWTKVLKYNQTYSIVETNQGDYAISFDGVGVSEDGEFTVVYGEKYGEEDFPTISINITNYSNSTVAGTIDYPEDEDDDIVGGTEEEEDQGVLGIIDYGDNETSTKGAQAKTSDDANFINLLIVMMITAAIFGGVMLLRKTTTDK